MSDRLARKLFLASAAALVLGGVFVWGYATRHLGTWPYGLIDDTRRVTRSLVRYGRVVPENLLVPAPADAAGTRTVIHDPARMQAGWYVVSGWDPSRKMYAAWLLDDEGAERHVWPIVYARVDPDGPLNGAGAPHGLVVMADGSLLVNFDQGDAMGRLDPCGEPIWVRQGIFHHSFDRDDDGSVWTWHAQGTPYGHHHDLLRFDPDTGEPLETISLVDDVIRRDVTAEMVLATRGDFRFRHFARTPNDPTAIDLYHPNDIEVLNAADAAAFPDFAAGDLLISIRNLDLIAVLDRQDHHLEWWRHGPWIEQHDPDFLPDGRISVYANNPGHGRSEIITIDPGSGHLANDLHDGGVRFDAPSMGKHQYLPDGNVLIVAPAEGRVLVTTSDGLPVFEFNNVVPDLPGVHAHVANAVWLPPDHFATLPACATAP